jgi:lipoyl(octanoyl) transferase
MNEVQVYSLVGDVDYRAAWRLQEHLVALRQAGLHGDALLLLEHAPTITWGRRLCSEHLLQSPSELLRRGIALVASDRGGAITWHGPGQIVLYAIRALQPRQRDLGAWLRTLEQVILELATGCGLQAYRRPGWTGVWCDDGKLAAIGVRAARWVTSHGVALNWRGPLDGFENIIPCGLSDRRVTSLQLQGVLLSRVEIEQRLIAAWCRVLGETARCHPEQELPGWPAAQSSADAP